MNDISTVVFGLLGVVFAGLFWIKTLNMKITADQQALQIKERADFRFTDRPRPYIFKFITIPKYPDSPDQPNTDQPNTDQLNNSLNGRIEIMNGAGVVRYTMFMSKPSQLIKKFIENAGVDYEKQIVHLINYENMEKL